MNKVSETMKDAVVYVGNFIFPNGNAAGKRVHGNLRAIQKAGYAAYAIGFHDKKYPQVIDGITSFSIPYSAGLKRLNNRRPVNFFIDIIKKINLKNRVKFVIMYGSLGTVTFNRRVLVYCKKNHITVLYDRVDIWTLISKRNILRYVMKKIDTFRLKYNILSRCDGGIAISSYIERASFDRVPSIIIPPLAVEVCEPLLRQNDSKIVIAYATFISDKNRPLSEWKDRIDAMIDIAEVLVDSQITNFCIKFIGFTEENLLDMFIVEDKQRYKTKLVKLKEYIIFLGVCSNNIAQSEIRQADFTFLLRDNKISSNAGFPTKVSESLALGVPVLTNLTSDLEQYITDGINGVVLKEPDKINENVEIIKKVLMLDRERINTMKKNASLNCKFIYSDYSEKFKEFFEQLCEEKENDLE